MKKEEFIQEIIDQYRTKVKFFLDLDINVKQKVSLMEVLNNIPEDIIGSVTWVRVMPNNFEPTIETTSFQLNIKKKQVSFVFFIKPRILDNEWILTEPVQQTRYPNSIKPISISVPRENFGKYHTGLIERYYESILKSL